MVYDFFGGKDSCVQRIKMAWKTRGKEKDPLLIKKVKKRRREKIEMMKRREAIAKRKETSRDFDRDSKLIVRDDQQQQEDVPLSKKEQKIIRPLLVSNQGIGTKFANWRRFGFIHKQTKPSYSNNRYAQSYHLVRVKKQLVYWHQHPDNISKRMKGKKADQMTILAKKEAETIRSITDPNNLYDYLMQLASTQEFLFVKIVLSNLSLATLTSIMQLVESKADENFNWDYYKKLFGSDVTNSALLRDIFKRRRQLLSSRPFSPSSSTDTNNKINNSDSNSGKLNHWQKSEYGSGVVQIFDEKVLDDDACIHPILTINDPTCLPKNYPKLPLVPTFELFQICFSVFSNNVMRGIEAKDWYIAGGSVLACLMPLPDSILRKEYRQTRRILAKNLPIFIVDYIMQLNSSRGGLIKELRNYYEGVGFDSFINSDIDLMFQLNDLTSAPTRFEEMCDKIKSNCGSRSEFDFHLSKNTVTISATARKQTYRRVQLVLSVLKNIEEHMQFADLDCTSCAYDGKQVVCVPRFVRAINYRCNLISPQLLRHTFEQIRVAKYMYPKLIYIRHRGFSAQIFELCKHYPRCDVKVEDSVRKSINALIRVADGEAWKSIDTWSDGKLFTDRDTYEAALPSAELYKSLQISWDGLRWKWEDLLWRTGRYYLPRCYVCKEPFYPEELSDMLCSECNNREQEKWNQWDNMDLNGRTALVTGARIKIGYQCAKRLLRSGCTVIAVTRFPNDAIKKYSQEHDFETWKDRLHVYGLDLRHLPSVMMFIQHVSQFYPQLAQTIRRPMAYFYSLLQFEKQSVYSGAVKIVGKDPIKLIDYSPTAGKELVQVQNNILTNQVVSFTEMALLPEDNIIRNDELFPPGQVDAHNEQLDLRKETTWVNNMEQVSVVEALEVQTINSTVPFMLISQLTPALKKAAAKNGSAYVINVTSAEGDFNFQWRNDSHPHTTSLNMMTKSIAGTFAVDKIFVNAVDTGWVSLMNPTLNGTAPLTEMNGAMRVLDPIFTGLTQVPVPFGQLFRNYKTIKWV